VEAGGNPARLHLLCEHPTTPFGVVDACGTCGAGTTPKCNSACTGYTAEPPPNANVYRPAPVPTILRTRDRCVVTLAVGTEGDELHALTGPSQRAYAAKIGADYHVIAGRTQSESMVCFEKFRVRPYAEAYLDGTLYLDADVFVMGDAPDVFAAVPETSIGMVDISPRVPNEWIIEQMAALCQSQGVPVLTPDPHYWNSGVWVGRPVHAGYWTPPPLPIPGVRWCDEEQWCRRNTLSMGVPILNIDRRWNWTWCDDRSFSFWDEARPWFVHLAGMGNRWAPQDWALSMPAVRKLLLKVMEAMRNL